MTDMILSGKKFEQRLDQEVEILGQVEGQYVASPNEFADQIDDMCKSGDEQSGVSLPWSNVDGIWRVRPGELTLWCGINGHGKSLAVGMAMCEFIKSQSVIIASLEMQPKQTLYRMVRQAAHCAPSSSYARTILDSWDQKLWIYDQLDTVASDRILALVHYSAKVLKVDHVVIDSLLKCGIGYEDYNGEKKFIERLQWAAKTYNIHIHLVCHVKKVSDENQRLTKFDVRGAGAIGDIADNIIIVQRNKNRERLVRLQQSGKLLSDSDLKIINEHAGVWFSVEKNRHYPKEGLCGLFYHEQSMQLTNIEGRALGRQI